MTSMTQAEQDQRFKRGRAAAATGLIRSHVLWSSVFGSHAPSGTRLGFWVSLARDAEYRPPNDRPLAWPLLPRLWWDPLTLLDSAFAAIERRVGE